MSETYHAGIDLGGTNIAALIINGDGKAVARAKEKTEVGLGVGEMAAVMRSVLERALEKGDLYRRRIASLGVAVPSAVDPQTGILLHAPNLGWKNEPAQAIFNEVFERETVLGNDADCGLLGEYWAGTAGDARTVVGFFLGTGLGGGIIINGRLHVGNRGLGGELGHHIIRRKGRRCGCGKRGCLEAYCSKTAFARKLDKKINQKGKSSVLTEYAGKDFSRLRSKHLKKAYLAGDKVVCKVLNKGAEILGIGAANMSAVLAPDCLIFGGGVMEALGEQLLPLVRQGFENNLFALNPKDVDLRLSRLGDDAVPAGAARLAMMNTDYSDQ